MDYITSKDLVEAYEAAHRIATKMNRKAKYDQKMSQRGSKRSATLRAQHIAKEKKTARRQARREMEKLSCHICLSKEDCPYAYDPNNTDGNCLAVK